jgi:hypothetical protein
VRNCPRGAKKYLVQGAKRMLGHLACHTRPREVDRNLIAGASHVIVFELPNVDDRRHIAELVGVPFAELDAAMVNLPPRSFLWWNLEERTLMRCPPVQR